MTVDDPHEGDGIAADFSVFDQPATLCSLFVTLLPVTGASISVFGETGGQSTICSSNATAAKLEELQFDLGEGPHWEALRTGTPVMYDGLPQTHGTDWPVFWAAALELSVGALFAFPLRIGAATVGVVDLYRETPGGLGDAAVATALSLSRRVAAPAVRAAVLSASENAPAERVAAPALRREVHQAVGMILVQLDTDATEAFARLRAQAFSSNRSVQEVAHDVVNRKIDFELLPE